MYAIFDIEQQLVQVNRAMREQPDTIRAVPMGVDNGAPVYQIVWRDENGRDSKQTLDNLTENEVIAYLRGALWMAAMKPDERR